MHPLLAINQYMHTHNMSCYHEFLYNVLNHFKSIITQYFDSASMLYRKARNDITIIIVTVLNGLDWNLPNSLFLHLPCRVDKLPPHAVSHFFGFNVTSLI